MTPNVNEKLAGILVPLDALREDPQNVRKHSARNIDAIAASYRRFGQQRPIVALADGTVIAGNGQLAAARKLGWDAIAVVRFTDEAQARAFAIADNRTAELAEWEYEGLESQLKALGDITFLDEMAFDLERKVADAYPGETPVADPGPIDAPANPVTRPGDIWCMGDHMLVCGDACTPGVLQALGTHHSLLLTDPPYNVAYVGKTKDALTIENDKQDDAQFLMFLSRAFQAADAVMVDGAVFYIFHAPTEGLNFRAAVKTVGWKLAQVLVWAKDRFVMGRQDYHWRHEPILYGWKLGAAHHALEDRTQDTVWECPRPARSEEHPTMKPVELFARAIRNSSDPGEVVLDPFAGSGTTLMACEQTGREARLVEIDPAYCDVIARRWMEATGREAVTANGETFTAVAAARGAPPP